MKQKLPRAPFTAALFATLLLTCVLLPGCGGSGPERFPVSGNVTLGGQPVKQGAITFWPIEGTQSPLTGSDITDGEYDIPGDKGPMAGRYQVQFEVHKHTGEKWPDIAGRLTIDAYVDITPKKYSGETSELYVEIGDGSTEHNFELETE